MCPKPIVAEYTGIVRFQIYEYFKSNNLLYKSQYGFRATHSTELAGIEFVDKYCTI